jgi:AcrR family transcriptional regulator
VNDADARRRIMAAAVRCVQRHGIDRTSAAMIASEAGVSRPTLYAYFENRDEIVTQAAIAATESFVERVVAHASQFDSAPERLVEATLFSVRGIRAEPALAMRFGRGQLLSGPLNHDELFYAKLCLGPVVELAPELGGWIDEASELAARVIISLLSREPMLARTEEEERTFLYRWWPPALGLVGAGPSEGRSSGAREATAVPAR